MTQAEREIFIATYSIGHALSQDGNAAINMAVKAVKALKDIDPDQLEDDDAIAMMREAGL